MVFIAFKAIKYIRVKIFGMWYTVLQRYRQTRQFEWYCQDALGDPFTTIF